MKKSKNTDSNELEEESYAQTKSEELDKISEEKKSKSCVSNESIKIEKIQPKYEIFFKAAKRHKSYSDEYYESQNDHRLYKIRDKLELKILVEGHKFSILPVIKSLCHSEINGVLMDDDVSITNDFHGRKYKLNYISTYSYDEYMDTFKILAYQSSLVCLLVFSKESLTSINDKLDC
ncbi:hypothetical protein M9Y10_039450 [Tritrichomonas musculus]|uniref:Uncharacterized protein n=1 Tax=Tritrichomonas musculus TaxID=1915356 RepID=A0ABR2KEF9_9EUKA